MINVAIIDNQKMVRSSIKERLQSDNIKIVSEGTCTEEMLELYDKQITDVIISEVDKNMNTTIQSVKRLLNKRPYASVIILTSNEDTECAKELIRLGVKGYLFKTSGRNKLKEAVTSVKNGHTYLDVDLIKEMMLDVKRLRELEIATAPQPIKRPPNLLIKREWEVLQQLSYGLSNDTIAKKMYLSEDTIKNYVSSILKKLKAEHRTHAVVMAIKNNWVLL